MKANLVKAGERIARQLEKRLIEAGWSAGHYLGREEDLARQIGASRAIVREAIAIAEMDGFIECRRGQAGGLFVGIPAADTRNSMLRNYLVFAGVKGSQIQNARLTIEKILCEAVARRATRADAQKLRLLAQLPDDRSPASYARHNTTLNKEILSLAQMPPLALCMTPLLQANTDIGVWNGASESDVGQLSAETADLRRELVEALISFDDSRMLAIQHQLSAAHVHWTERFSTPPTDVEDAIVRLTMLGQKFAMHGADGRLVKKPQAVARLIASSIAGDPPDREGRIGSEDEIVRRLGVSGGVFREAVRTLERYGIVRVRRGNDGGLFKRTPDPQAIVNAVGLFIATTQRPSPVVLGRTVHRLGRSATTLVVNDLEQGNELTRKELVKARAALTDEKPPDLFGSYRFLANAVEDQVLVALLGILLVPLDAIAASADSAPYDAQQMKELQRSFLDLIEARDLHMARRCLVELGRIDVVRREI